MGAFLIWSALIIALPFLTSAPKTTVVLLDNDSTHNAIDVTTNTATVSIDQPYYYTTLKGMDKNPSDIEKADPAKIDEKYGTLVEALGSKATSILFYFEPGTTQLTQASKDQVGNVINIIRSKEPAAVDIIGHSDRAGDADKNYLLALDRAKEVEKYLLDQNVTLKHCSVVSHGEDDPIIPTADGVEEPQNRRVEVIVR
jgi:outer membrane protein OmpA-like peptidoglycan-associated protein